MAWKIISLHGWWVSFERDSDVYLKHEEVSGFSSIEKIEAEIGMYYGSKLVV